MGDGPNLDKEKAKDIEKAFGHDRDKDAKPEGSPKPDKDKPDKDKPDKDKPDRD